MFLFQYRYLNGYDLFHRPHYCQVEQPGSSCLKDCPYISHVLASMGPHFFRRMWMGNYGHWAAKPSQLWGSWSPR